MRTPRRRAWSRVQELVRAGIPVTEIAVLHRYHAQNPVLRAALLAAGLPVTKLKDDEGFFQATPVARAVQNLRQVEQDEDGLVATEHVLHLQGFDPDSPPSDDGAQLDRHELRSALLQLVRNLPSEVRLTVARLREELRRLADEEREPKGEGVTVGTIHAAKGLEWNAVLLPRMTDGSLPASFARSPEQQAEERRLFYVAVTRAREVVRLSWAARSDTRSNRPSPFLDALAPLSQRAPGMVPALAPPPGQRGATPKASTRMPTPSRWGVGGRVLHDSYGLGSVVELQPGAAMVDFGATYGVKRVSSTTRKMARLGR